MPYMPFPDVYLKLSRMELNILELAMAGRNYRQIVDQLNLNLSNMHRIDEHVVDSVLCRVKKKMTAARVDPMGSLPLARKQAERPLRGSRRTNQRSQDTYGI